MQERANPKFLPSSAAIRRTIFARLVIEELDMRRMVCFNSCVSFVVVAATFLGLAGCDSHKSNEDSSKGDAAGKQKKDKAPHLALTPGGIYTEADVKANGSITPKDKYPNLQHAGGTLKEGDKICPDSGRRPIPNAPGSSRAKPTRSAARPASITS